MTYRSDAEVTGGPPPGCPAHQGGTDGTFRVPMFGHDFAADPHQAYARMREYGPIAPVELAPGVQASLVTSYPLALEILRDTERFAKDPRTWRAVQEGEIGEDSPVAPMMMYRPNALFADGDAHTRLRGAITDSLNRVDPHALSEYVERSADTLIDAFIHTGEADLLRDYAGVLPLLVFNQLFGSPVEDGPALVVMIAQLFESGEDAVQANENLVKYMTELIASKRSRPGADVTSWLVTHSSQLADEELMQQMVLLMAAGTEPEQNLILNALRLLLADDRFAGELSGGSLPVQDALDEVLWTDPPMANFGTVFPRYDVDVAGVRLLRGDPVLISYAAANTDPDLESSRRPGNRAHLAWSAGAHRCPAEGPARVIASVAIEKLLDRLPDIELAVSPDELAWRPGPFHRALVELPVRFPAVSAPMPAPLSASDQLDETPGDSRWKPDPRLSSSTPQAPISTQRRPGSGSSGRRRPWSFLAAWWRGR